MSRSTTQLKCYYHPQNIITKMCLHQQCLLPLCSQCLQIHDRQNSNSNIKKQAHKVVSYQQAQNIAINNLKQQHQRIQEQMQILDKKLTTFKNILRSMLQKQLTNIQNNLKTNIYSFENNLQKCKNQEYMIKSNNLNSLILHFERKCRQSQVCFQFVEQIDGKEFQSVINKFYGIQKISKLVQMNASKIQIDNSSTNVNVKKGINKLFCLNQSDLKQSLSVKKKSKSGIFVTASPKQPGSLLKPSTPQRNTLQKTKQVENLEILEQLSVKDIQNEVKITQSTISKRKKLFNKSTNQNSQNIMHQAQGQKQDTLFPKKISIYIQSPRYNDNNILKQSKNSSSQLKYKRSIINRSQLASNSSSSRLLTSKNKDKQIFNQILSPEQMKLLIIKKTTNPKEQILKHLISQQSNNI